MSQLRGGTIKSVWGRDKGMCHLCGHKVALDDASRDHIEPASMLGSNHGHNYRISHKRCNHARGDLPIDIAYEVVADLRAAGVRTTPQVVQEALYARLREYRRWLRAGQRRRA